jgi:hypothetical protein
MGSCVRGKAELKLPCTSDAKTYLPSILLLFKNVFSNMMSTKIFFSFFYMYELNSSKQYIWVCMCESKRILHVYLYVNMHEYMIIHMYPYSYPQIIPYAQNWSIILLNLKFSSSALDWSQHPTSRTYIGEAEWHREKKTYWKTWLE